MNICFLIGKIISDINFKFVLNSYHISIVTFDIQLGNESIVKIKAYDEMADWCYQKLVKGNLVVIQGKIDYKMEIIIESIENIIF